jgi:hypothetical protein
LVALTLVAGTILWTFHIYTPPSPPTISFVIHTGGSNPAWGDPTDCQPQGYNLNFYRVNQTTGALRTWVGNYSDQATAHTWYGQCGDSKWGSVSGNFSLLNTSEFVITAHSPGTILLSQIDFTFICNNASNRGGTTILVNGSLSSMTWFPGSGTLAPGAPYLGYCGNFDAGSSTAANGIYYNRLGLFQQLNTGDDALQNGDTFILYIHNGGWPLDFMCVANAAGIVFDGQNPPSWNGCLALDHSGNPEPLVTMDYDDYHGAPPWCFTSMNACTIELRYMGYPSTVLAKIPVFELAPTST